MNAVTINRRTDQEKLQVLELSKSRDVIWQFIDSCSHAMRGPLKTIEGLVNLLKQRSKYSEADAGLFIDLIAAATDKMDNTLHQLEQMLENSQRPVAQRKFDCMEMIQNMLTKYRDDILSAEIAVTVEIDKPVEFSCDEPRLRLILTHLFENAVMFRDKNKSERSITISVENTNPGYRFTISDNGIGIAPQTMENIFRLFYRGSAQSTGAGVGLYVVREAVEKMRGSIAVESGEGVGTTFTVELPDCVLVEPAST
jgi:signal transduction histidine kinase